MLKKIFNAIFGIAESTAKESISEVKTLFKFYAYIVLLLMFLLICLIIFGLFSMIF